MLILLQHAANAGHKGWWIADDQQASLLAMLGP